MLSWIECIISLSYEGDARSCVVVDDGVIGCGFFSLVGVEQFTALVAGQVL